MGRFQRLATAAAAAALMAAATAPHADRSRFTPPPPRVPVHDPAPVAEPPPVRRTPPVQSPMERPAARPAKPPATASSEPVSQSLAVTVTVAPARPESPRIPLAITVLGGNPSPDGIIRYDLGSASSVSVAVYGVSGRRIASLDGGFKEPGSYSLTWDGRDDDGRRASPGVYFVRVTAGPWTASRKLVLR